MNTTWITQILSGWTNPLTSTLCPFCFERFQLYAAPLRPLENAGDQPPPFENDTALADFLGLPEALLPPLKKPDPAFWGKLRLDNSVLSQNDRACPKCHLPLPVALARGEADSRLIAIVGDRWSGKSNFFASLVHQLNDSDVLQEAGIDFLSEDSFDPDTVRKKTSQKLWEERFGRYILGDNLDGQNRRPVPVTDLRKVNSALRTPLIYRFQISRRASRGWSTAPFRSVMLVLYDSAGEDLENQENMRRWYRYLVQADAIMFLTDPLRLPGLRQVTAEGQAGATVGQPPNSKSSDVFDNLISLFEREQLGIHQVINKPTAFVFTKCDALRSSLPADSRIPFPSHHESGFDLDDVEQLHAEVLDHARDWGFGKLLGKIERRFPNHLFSAVSALGSQPRLEGEVQLLDEYAPIRVVDPLFWLLHRLGYLRANTQ
jgi:hypothetical protein